MINSVFQLREDATPSQLSDFLVAHEAARFAL